MKSPLKWYGGKGMIANWIVSHFPAHSIYVEPFGGGASVLFAKEPVGVEVYNDINESVWEFFTVLRNQGDAFIKAITLTPYHENVMRIVGHSETPLGRACVNFSRWRQSFAGKGDSWSRTTRRSRCSMADNVSGWLSAVEGLPTVVERLRRVQFCCEDAIAVINRFDTPDAIIYCDPPYVHNTRTGSKAVYTHEYTDEQHRELAAELNRTSAKVCLSGYPSPLYDELYAGWRTASKNVANHAAGGRNKRRMTETLWMNYL